MSENALLEDLEWRGLIAQSTDRKELEKALSKPISLYLGVDPTAPSMHLGNLVVFLVLRRFQLAGHRPIPLVGGATGLVGDPSGKNDERTLNEEKLVADWVAKIKKQVEKIIDFGDKKLFTPQSYNDRKPIQDTISDLLPWPQGNFGSYNWFSVMESEQAKIKIVLESQPPEVEHDKVKELIQDEFNRILNLTNFSSTAYDTFRRWYIDGRLFFHCIINESKPDAGIIEMRQIDPTKIRKIKETEKVKDPKTGADLVKEVGEYYLYQDDVMTNNGEGLRINTDSIIQVNSGLLNEERNKVIGYLNKALKPINQLSMMEDSLVIYRISRAPERRIFYIDVGNLPKGKAEEYLNSTMNKYRNKVVYDPTTGNILVTDNGNNRIQKLYKVAYYTATEAGNYKVKYSNGTCTSSFSNSISITDPFTHMKGRDARSGGEINRAVAKQIGAIAYKELIDMTSQQAIQALKRMYGSDISKATLDEVISRLEALRGITKEKWRTGLAGRD